MQLDTDSANKATRARQKLVYIMSPSYSGSTLLTMLLALHPKVSTIGELKATSMGPIKDYNCSCGSKIEECSFWKDITSDMHNLNREFSLDHFGTHFASTNPIFNKILGSQVRNQPFELVRKTVLANTPKLNQEYQKIIEQNYLLSKLISQHQNADIFLDGSKDPHRLLYLYQSGKWDIHVIRLYRDGRAQSQSQVRKTQYPIDFSGAAKEWRYTIDQMEIVSNKLPSDRITEITYEDLCQDPGLHLGRIWNALQLEPLQLDWENVDLKAKENHILGNNMRNKDRISISLDRKWLEQVDKKDLDTFERISGPLNRKIGYL